MFKRGVKAASRVVARGNRATSETLGKYTSGELPTEADVVSGVNKHFEGAHPLAKGGAVLAAKLGHVAASHLHESGYPKTVSRLALAGKKNTDMGGVLLDNTIKSLNDENMYNFFVKNKFIDDTKMTLEQFKVLNHSNIGISGLIDMLYNMCLKIVNIEQKKNPGSQPDLSKILGIEEMIKELYKIVNDKDFESGIFTDPRKVGPTAADLYPTTAKATGPPNYPNGNPPNYNEGGSSCSRKKHKKSRKNKNSKNSKKGKNGKRVTRKHRGGAKKTRKSNKNTKRKQHKHRRTKRKC